MVRLKRKERSLSGPNEMMSFRLTGLLESDHVLIFNPQLGTFSVLAPGPDLLEEQQFTVSELCLLIPLLQSYPYYCPYEQLLASYAGGQATVQDIDRSRRRLHKAQQEGRWDECVRPMRGALSRARLKMRSFGIDVVAVTETGYMLKRLKRAPHPPSEVSIEAERSRVLV
ncbi:hypothetical protein [Dictyobacter formicarum]|uniref:OmpR/PhoB-type domain-containing protein n=1 Tax=Dictyobacter formicarum TaxID=2778368 RepID=A0ABQ3VA90_9CHLR|nr:hypothetical protein [Dictyobacter formicarum]GHO82338.1 hypothetical protein KSZ_03440 [Dictyobacter formicarum]